MGKISLHSIKITKQDCLLISKSKDKAERISHIRIVTEDPIHESTYKFLCIMSH